MLIMFDKRCVPSQRFGAENPTGKNLVSWRTNLADGREMRRYSSIYWNTQGLVERFKSENRNWKV